MRIVIAGGHGQIALIMQRILSEAGHEPVGLIRNPDQAADLLVVGGIPLVIDLEHTDVETLATDLVGVDAVVFAAGSGPNSGADRKLTVDRDGAILLAEAAEKAGVQRYVMVSARRTDGFDPDSDDVFQVYLRAKSEADADLRGRELDWTVVRPGALTNDPPTGLVHLAEDAGDASVTRADVAALVVETLVGGHAVRQQFEMVSGETPIGEALSALG